MRKEIRLEIEKEASFIEVFIKASIESCKKRDKKGLYEKAKKGMIKDFTGVNSIFEAPQNPEITIDTNKLTEDESALEIINYLEK
jgi:adenylylsulfate kinase-like enzyme